jgi:hypothetical protein
MTYHMARIVHWVNNSNITPFPTHIYRQIYQPPFSELFVAHICILNKSDLLANSVQLFFLMGCIVSALLICRELHFSAKAKRFALFFICTTPEILLQASSVQNDIIVSFFLLNTVLLCIKSYKDNRNLFLY